MSIPGLTPPIRGYLRRYRRYLAAGFFLAAAFNGFRMMGPRVLRQAVRRNRAGSRQPLPD